MRSILFDELQTHEIEAVRKYLDDHAKPSGVTGLYWIMLDRELWAEPQLEAANDDSGAVHDGFRIAVEIGSDWVKFELLIRAEAVLNIGGGPANENQTLFVIRWADKMATDLQLTSCLPG